MSHDADLVAKVAEALIAEGAAPGSSLHSWRCEYPDQYGECDCVAETARAVLDALDLPGRERRAKAEGIREAVARVRWVYDLQCPVPTTGRYHKWARLAHLWWQKVLGGELERLSRRAAEIDPEEGDHE